MLIEYYFLISHSKHVLGTQKNHLNERVLVRTQKHILKLIDYVGKKLSTCNCHWHTLKAGTVTLTYISFSSDFVIII